jgi:hypothetical protein
MVADDALRTALLDLHHELEEYDIKLLLGGGYGLFLKQNYLMGASERTLFAQDLWPAPRSTSDLDIFLKAEVVADVTRMELLRDALRRLGFKAIDSARFYQFVKESDSADPVKIDLLVGPLGEHSTQIKTDGNRRARPRNKSVQLHAHPVPEAISIENEALPILTEGVLSTGNEYAGEVFIPQGFSYLLMKLNAFRDQRDNTEKDEARHHALDLYRILAMMTRPEYELARRLSTEHSQEEKVVEAREIAKEYFGAPESLGSLRLQEHPLFSRAMDVERFLSELAAIIGHETE